jgi:hypothetical protein
MTRGHLIFSGLFGLTGSLLLTTFSVAVMVLGYIPALLQQPLFIWGLFLFLLILSLLEIPVMILALRRMATSTAPRASYVTMLTNMAYTFFAGVYAMPFILLAGATWQELLAGIGLACLSIVRFITSLVFVPYEKRIQSNSN